MILDTSSKAIAWMVKNGVSCSGYTVDRIVAAKLDTDSDDALAEALEIEEQVFSAIENAPTILRELRIAKGLEFDDSSHDEELKSYSREEALQTLLEWEGIIGYTNKILKWLEDIDAFQKELAKDKTSRFVSAKGKL